MKIGITFLVIISALLACIKAQTDTHPPCVDDSCAHVTCEKDGEVAECHDKKCHCHAEVECFKPSDCHLECGNLATCDHGHCHGPNCTHT